MMMDIEQILGKHVGNYRLISLLGRGSFGAVFEAERDSQPFHHVALKVFMPMALPYNVNTVDIKNLVNKFLVEAAILQKLVHPHIVSVSDFGQDNANGLIYMAMPILSGGSLSDMKVPLRFSEIVKYAKNIASALDYAHGL